MSNLSIKLLSGVKTPPKYFNSDTTSSMFLGVVMVALVSAQIQCYHWICAESNATITIRRDMLTLVSEFKYYRVEDDQLATDAL